MKSGLSRACWVSPVFGQPSSRRTGQTITSRARTRFSRRRRSTGRGPGPRRCRCVPRATVIVAPSRRGRRGRRDRRPSGPSPLLLRSFAGPFRASPSAEGSALPREANEVSPLGMSSARVAEISARRPGPSGPIIPSLFSSARRSRTFIELRLRRRVGAGECAGAALFHRGTEIWNSGTASPSRLPLHETALSRQIAQPCGNHSRACDMGRTPLDQSALNLR